MGSPAARNSKCYLFGLGARWGIGHSTGLLLVGGIFILKDVIQNGDGNDSKDTLEIPDSVTRLFESFVGLFMLLLGFYGIYEAHRIKNGYCSVGPIIGDVEDENNNFDSTKRYRDDERDENDDSDFNPDSDAQQSCLSGAVAPFEMEAAEDISVGSGCNEGRRRPQHEAFDDDLEEFRYNVQVMLGTVSTDENVGEGNGTSDFLNRHHHHDHDHSNSPFLALCAGIFHGLAGPGGVLGVVPAIQLHNAGLAACYLFSFCTSSTLTMGTFASAYGTFTAGLARCCSSSVYQQNESTRNIVGAENDNDTPERSSPVPAIVIVEFWIRCFSASLSVLVGVVWLVLLAMGKLEDVFP